MSTINTILGTDVIANSRTVINTNFSNLNTDKIETSTLDTDTALTANSDSKIATQKAVKAYVDSGGQQNASTTVRGLVEEATQAELTAGTQSGGTGARLFVNPVHTTSTSAGAGDAGKLPRLNASGLLDSTLITTPFITQDVDIYAGTDTPVGFNACSSADGSVLYVGYILSGTTTTLNIKRFTKDSGTGDYTETHATTLTITGGSSIGMVVIGSFLYVCTAIAATGAVRRYAVADLSGVTTMTVSGTNDFATGGTTFTNGTDLYQYSSAGTFRIYTISGTTITAGSTVAYTSSGTQPYGVYGNATNAWICDALGSTFNIRKYAIAGGAVVSTTTRTIYPTARLNGGAGQFHSFFNPSTAFLGIAYIFNWTSASAVVGMSLHLKAITLP